jgi:hypothetical protein
MLKCDFEKDNPYRHKKLHEATLFHGPPNSWPCQNWSSKIQFERFGLIVFLAYLISTIADGGPSATSTYFTILLYARDPLILLARLRIRSCCATPNTSIIA